MKNKYTILFFILILNHLAVIASVKDTLKVKQASIGKTILNKENEFCDIEIRLSNLENKNNYTYHAKVKVILDDSYRVQQSNEYIQVKAGQQIVFKPNTKIDYRSYFLAKIETCNKCEKSFSFNNFFTPNGDGSNDLWKVNWDDVNFFISVSIFDRYGKLLKSFKDVNDFWDGTSNGINVFANDYWFLIEYLDCNYQRKKFNSHFSLIR